MTLLSWLILVLIALVVFGLVVCISEREWGTLIFAAVMFAGIAWLMWYGAGHTPAG